MANSENKKLTDDVKSQRVRFAEQYLNSSPEFWHRVIFSDEQRFG